MTHAEKAYRLGHIARNLGIWIGINPYDKNKQCFEWNTFNQAWRDTDMVAYINGDRTQFPECKIGAYS